MDNVDVDTLDTIIRDILDESILKLKFIGFHGHPRRTSSVVLYYTITLSEYFDLNFRAIYQPNAVTRVIDSSSRSLSLMVSKLNRVTIERILVSEISRRIRGIDREQEFLSFIRKHVLYSVDTRDGITVLTLHRASTYRDRRGVDYEVVCLRDYCIRLNDIPIQLKSTAREQFEHKFRYPKIPSIVFQSDAGKMIEKFWVTVIQYCKGRITHL